MKGKSVEQVEKEFEGSSMDQEVINRIKPHKVGFSIIRIYVSMS